MKAKDLCAYFFAACLMCFYLFVLWYGTSYDVSDEYRMYYISGDLRYCVPDGALSTYTTDKCIYASGGNYFNQGRGWRSPEKSYTWCIGNRSDMYFTVNDPTVDHIFRISVVIEQGRDNELWVGETFVQKLPPGLGTFDIFIDKAYLTDGLNTLSIKTGDDVIPYHRRFPIFSDAQQSNIAVSSVQLMPAAAVVPAF